MEDIMIWVMESGIYDVLQIYGMNDDNTAYNIWVNNAYVTTIDNDDDIVYITLEDLLNLFGKSSSYEIVVQGVNESDTLSYSNIVVYRNKNDYENLIEVDYTPSFRATYSKMNFYLDGELLETVIYEFSYHNFSSQNLMFDAATLTYPNNQVSITFKSELYSSTRTPVLHRSYIYSYPVAIDQDSLTVEKFTVSFTDDYGQGLEIKVNSTDQQIRKVSKLMYAAPDSREMAKYLMPTSGSMLIYSEFGEFELSLGLYPYWNGTLQYSYDEENWTTINYGSTNYLASQNNRIYLKGNITSFYNSSTLEQGLRLNADRPIKVYNASRSSITSTVSVVWDYLFYQSTSLIELNGTLNNGLNTCFYCQHLETIGDWQFGTNSFSSCIELKTIGKCLNLPSSSIDAGQYTFRNCLSLKTLPSFLSELLSPYSYNISGSWTNCPNIKISEYPTKDYLVPFKTGNASITLGTIGGSSEDTTLQANTVYYLSNDMTIV